MDDHGFRIGVSVHLSDLRNGDGIQSLDMDLHFDCDVHDVKDVLAFPSLLLVGQLYHEEVVRVELRVEHFRDGARSEDCCKVGLLYRQFGLVGVELLVVVMGLQ